MPRIGFLGAGKMATALASGFLSNGYAQASEIIASDILPDALNTFQKKTGATVTDSNEEVLKQADVIIVALKPQVAHDALLELRDNMERRHLVVSIMAGVEIFRLQQLLGLHTRVVRVMPNTPALVGAGASGYSLGSEATAEDGLLVKSMLETVGVAVEVQEHLLNAVTGLSGSGPAYVFQIIEALSDGGVRMGLPRAISTRLAAQTLLGAAKMVLETGEHPGSLKDAVASPGGTTIAGLHELERGGLRAALMNAVQAATNRSIQLSEAE